MKKNATTKKNATKKNASQNVETIYRFNSVNIVNDNRDDFQKACAKYEYAQENADKRLYKYNFNASKSSLNSTKRVETTSVNYNVLNEYSKSMSSHADRYTLNKRATVYVRNNSYKVEVRSLEDAKLIENALHVEYTTLKKSYSFKRLDDSQLRVILSLLFNEETITESEE